MSQSFTISLPEGYHIMALESSFTHKGAYHYRVYVRHTESSQFRGGQSFDDPQPAVDAALAALKKSMQDSFVPRTKIVFEDGYPILKLNLDISALRRPK